MIRTSPVEYFGTIESIQKIWLDSIRKGVSIYTTEQRNYIETYYHINFDEILSGKVKIRHDLVDKVGEVGALGTMKFVSSMTEGEKEYWKEDMKKAGAFSTGPELTPEFYVKLLALERIDDSNENVDGGSSDSM